MPTSTYLSNPVVTVNSVDLTDQCTSATFTHRFDSLEATSLVDGSGNIVRGVGSHELRLWLYLSYAASETYATLSALVGTSTTVKIKPTSAAASATNPEFTLTGCYLETLPLVNAALGALDTIDITFTGGVYTVSAP
jgi:hypothetical protein